MTRSCAALFVLAFAAAPAAAQVGYKPGESPYRNVPWKQSFGVWAGGFDTGRDVAGVGPQPGWLAGVRYDLRIGGPMSLIARVGGAPTSRRILDPTNPPATRHTGDENSQLMIADLGLGMNLTGQKSYHRVIPVLSGGVGVVSDFRGTPDKGGYRFGTRFAFTWGLGIRYHTDSKWEPRLDFSNSLWQLLYPPDYSASPSDGSPPIIKSGKKSAWMGNHLWSVGMSRQLFR